MVFDDVLYDNVLSCRRTFRVKQDKAVISVAVGTTKFIFGMCDCTVDRDVDTVDFSLVLEILYVCGQAYMCSHVSPGMIYRR